MGPVDVSANGSSLKSKLLPETVSVPHYPQAGNIESLTATLQVSTRSSPLLDCCCWFSTIAVHG